MPAPRHLALLLCLFAAPLTWASTSVPAQTISIDTTWGLAGSPYIVQGSVIVQGSDGPDGVTTLTIEPGVEVRFDERHDLQIGVSQPGALVADGNAVGGPATILFTSNGASPSAPFWDGILFGNNARASIVRNAIVEFSGRGTSFKGAIRVQPAGQTITLEDVTIRVCGDSFGSGLFVAGGSVEASALVFEDNVSYDVRASSGGGFVDASSLESIRFDNGNPTLTFSGNSITNFGVRASRLTPNVAARLALDNSVSAAPGGRTEIISGTQSLDGAWTSALGPLQPLGALTVQGSDGPDARTTLSIEGGVEVRMPNFAALSVGTSQPGALVVDGDLGPTPSPVLFTSAEANPAGALWGGIWLRGQAGESVLRNLVVAHAGRGGGLRGAVQVSVPAATAITIDRLTVRDNGSSTTAGLYMDGGTSTIDASVFENNTYYDLQLNNGSGAFTNTSFSSVRFEFFNPPFTFSGCTMPSWGALTSRVPADVAARLAPDNTVDALPGAVTEVTTSQLNVDGEFGPEVGTYRATGTLRVAGSDGPDGVTGLTLLPGARVEFPIFAGLEVGLEGQSPGRLVVSAGGAPAQLSSDSLSAGRASWEGVRIASNASASLEGLEVLFGNTCLDVRGALDAASDLFLKRCNTGFALEASSLPPLIERVRCNTVGTCVQTSNVAPVIRDSELVGDDFGLWNSWPATQPVDARDNWWGAPDGPSGEGSGSGAAVSADVLFEPWQRAPEDDGDGAPLDDGDGLDDPCTGGATLDCDDNCPAVANASQADADGDGIGDACESSAVLRVSSDAADAADFASVQAAVDAASAEGTRIEILPGLGPYDERVRLDRKLSLALVGVSSDPLEPVVIDGGSFTALATFARGAGAHRVEGITLRGHNGFFGQADALLEQVVFEGHASGAADLEVGDYRIVDARFSGGAANALSVRGNASALVERTRIRDMLGFGVFNDARVTIRSSIIAGNDKGLMTGAGSESALEFVTIVDNQQAGIDNAAGGSVSITDSIVFGNLGDDLVGVDCADVRRSNLGGAAGCAGAQGNISADPLLDDDRKLQPGSPCIDAGRDVVDFPGLPARDVDGEPRLAEGDAGGDPRTDCGADEYLEPAPPIGRVENLLFLSETDLVWDSVPGAALYHLYAGDIATLGPTSFGSCRDDLDPNLTDTFAFIDALPLSGRGDFYLVTAEDAAGNESILGYGSSSERPNQAACP